MGSRAGRGRRGVLSGRHNSTRAASIIRDARRSTRGIEGGGRSSTRAASISRARSASGNRTRGAAHPLRSATLWRERGPPRLVARGARVPATHPPHHPPSRCRRRNTARGRGLHIYIIKASAWVQRPRFFFRVSWRDTSEHQETSSAPLRLCVPFRCLITLPLFARRSDGDA